MSKIAILGGAAVILVALGGALWYTATDRVPEAGEATRPATGMPASGGTLMGLTPKLPSGGGPAPWAGATPPSSAAIAANQQNTRELEAMQADLAASLRAGATPDPRKVDAALAKIEEINGKNAVSGVNLDAVRANLAIAAKLQLVAADLEAESKKPGRPDTERLRTLVAQVQQLQSQMRADVSAPVAPPASPAAPK